MSHKDPENCPTCLWLSIRDDYETKFICEKKECADCLQVHLDLPFEWLRSLKGREGEFSDIIRLELRDYSSYNSSCVLKYAYYYLTHLLRNGDCLSVYGLRDKNKVILVYYHGNFYYCSEKAGPPYSLSPFIDIAKFGRANYFSRVIPYCVAVHSEFLGYRRKKVLEDESMGYSLWEISRDFDRSQISFLGHKLPSDLIGIIIPYLQDKWHVFAALGEDVPEAWKSYNYAHCSSRFNRGELARIEGGISDKTKILYTLAFEN